MIFDRPLNIEANLFILILNVALMIMSLFTLTTFDPFLQDYIFVTRIADDSLVEIKYPTSISFQ